MRSVVRRWADRILESWYVPVTWLWLLAMAFAQRVGRTTFDTKFDLTADPGGFLERSLSLWNPASSFGELQNQAYGYLFPQGGFFLAADVVGLPDWVAQRLWTGLLLIVAFEGCRRLARAMIGGDIVWASWLAGFAYATAPRFLGSVGVLSGEAPPVALLPWAILPIVLAQQGRIGPRTGALLSGVAMLGFGGVNAVGNLATLPVILFILLGSVRREGGRTLLGWWCGATALASAWWMLPLLVFGRYSPRSSTTSRPPARSSSRWAGPTSPAAPTTGWPSSAWVGIRGGRARTRSPPRRCWWRRRRSSQRSAWSVSPAARCRRGGLCWAAWCSAPSA